MASEDIIVEGSEKLSTSTTTPAIGSPMDGAALKETRSRRPTMANVTEMSPSLEDATRRDSLIEPAVKEPWTAKRVVKVTWAYVTTVKVLFAMLTPLIVGIFDHDVYAPDCCVGRNVIPTPSECGTRDVSPHL